MRISDWSSDVCSSDLGATTIAGCCPCRCPCGSSFSRSHKCPAGRLTLLRPRAVMRAPIRGKATMSDLQARFEQAKQDVQGLSERPDNDTLLRLYALYKQGSEEIGRATV